MLIGERVREPCRPRQSWEIRSCSDSAWTQTTCPKSAVAVRQCPAAGLGQYTVPGVERLYLAGQHTLMKIFGADGKEMMTVSSLERDGSTLVIKGKIFGTMPLTARLRPAEARKAFGLLNFRLALFLLTLPFRR